MLKIIVHNKCIKIDFNNNIIASTRIMNHPQKSKEELTTDKKIKSSIIKIGEYYASYQILLSDIVDPVKRAITFQDFVEFDNLLSQPDAEYLIVFKVLDTDKDGLLSKEELMRVIEANQESDSPPFNWNSDWVNLYFARNDLKLSYKEFSQLVKGNS
jgi:Ca2+-binding EF-hand superfamily protein